MGKANHAKDVRAAELSDLATRLDIARSTVFVTVAALDHGETDLELQAATALKQAFETIDTVYDELVSMANNAKDGVTAEVPHG